MRMAKSLGFGRNVTDMASPDPTSHVSAERARRGGTIFTVVAIAGALVLITSIMLVALDPNMIGSYFTIVSGAASLTAGIVGRRAIRRSRGANQSAADH
jgi:hypothetical protein